MNRRDFIEAMMGAASTTGVIYSIPKTVGLYSRKVPSFETGAAVRAYYDQMGRVHRTHYQYGPAPKLDAIMLYEAGVVDLEGLKRLVS